MFAEYTQLTSSIPPQQLPPPCWLRLSKVVLSKDAPSFDHFDAVCSGVHWSTRGDAQRKVAVTKLTGSSLTMELKDADSFLFLADFHLTFAKRKKVFGVASGGDARVFSCWLHTQFLPTDGIVRLERRELDKVNKQDVKDFSVALHFKPAAQGANLSFEMLRSQQPLP
jgi:hypothetical protein